MVPLPLISALLPVYNGESEVRRTVTSVQQQDLPEWELVIVNDGSTDTTSRVARGLAKQDERIRVFDLGRNLGRGGARNIAVGEAKGMYIAFCDAGDEFSSDRFSQSLTLFEENPQAVVVSGQIARRVRGIDVMDPHFLVDGATAAAALRLGLMRVATPTAMVRVQSFPAQPFDNRLRRCEDVFFFSRLARAHALDAFIVSARVFTYYDRPTHTPWRYWYENTVYARLARELADGGSGNGGTETQPIRPPDLRLPLNELPIEFMRWFAVDQRNRFRTLLTLRRLRNQSGQR